MSVKSAIDQIEFCNFECAGGSLKDNEGWQELKKILFEFEGIIGIVDLLKERSFYEGVDRTLKNIRNEEVL